MTGHRVPKLLVGLGLVFGIVVIGEGVAMVQLRDSFDIVGTVNILATLPFIVALVGVGYRLSRSDLDATRDRRIVAWVLTGIAFLGGFFLLIAVFTARDLLEGINIVRWGAAAGAGTGALVGFLEARAIQRAVQAERTEIANRELRRRNEQLEEFAGILAHDLRNPLTVANGYLEMVREESEDDRLTNIADAHDRLSQIIDRTLTLARSGQVIEAPEPIPLPELVNRCWGNVPTEKATLKIDELGTIRADPDRVQNLFENLFRNAVEHGGPAVTVRVGMRDDGFYVEDDGPGIPEGDFERVFRSGYSSADRGIGFGLSIVRQIARAHGWDIEMTEGSEGGVRFEFTGVETTRSPGARSNELAQSGNAPTA